MCKHQVGSPISFRHSRYSEPIGMRALLLVPNRRVVESGNGGCPEGSPAEGRWDQLCAWLTGNSKFRSQLAGHKQALRDHMGYSQEAADPSNKARRTVSPPGAGSSSSAAGSSFHSRPPPTAYALWVVAVGRSPVRVSGMVPRSLLKEGNNQMVEKRTKTTQQQKATANHSPKAESPPSCGLSSVPR